MRVSIVPSLEQLVADYKNTAAHNDSVFPQDAAFHAMWLRLLDHGSRRFGTIRAIEVGVFKGQVISLLAMSQGNETWTFKLARLHRCPVTRCHDPNLQLGSAPASSFREELSNGNFQARADYPNIITQLFDRFDLNLVMDKRDLNEQES